MDQIWEDRVRTRAYEIWEREGRKEGSHKAHWQQAEKELQEEGTRDPADGKGGDALSSNGSL